MTPTTVGTEGEREKEKEISTPPGRMVRSDADFFSFSEEKGRGKWRYDVISGIAEASWK